MEAIKKRIAALSKENIDIILSSLFLSYSFFIFGPLQIYLTNTTEFWFKLKHILPTMIISFFIVFIFIILFSHIIPRDFRKYYGALLFGVGFALYIQGNFINLDYGVLDGSEINWNSYGIWGILNTAIWILCITVPIILTRLWPKQLRKIIKAVSLFIVSIQVITSGVLLVGAKTVPNKDITVTTKDMFSLSPDKNVIIFILDAFDASYMNEILAEYPEYKEAFKDFTYYDNTLGAYPTTKLALPYILTGERYDNSILYNDYIDQAYGKTILYDILLAEGYDVGIYVNKKFISLSCKDIFSNISITEEKPSSYIGLGLMMYKSTAFTYLPHFIKRMFWYYTGDFDNYICSSVEDNSTLFTPDEVSFYQSLVCDGISFTNDAYAFRLYHLSGTHPPFTMTSDLKHNASGTTAIEEGIASLKTVLEYTRQLKESKAYNNTSIIIIADHGLVDMRQNPILLVKPVGSDKDFVVLSDPVSFDDLLNTILYMASGEKKYQPNIFSWSGTDRTRQYFYYDCRDAWEKEYMPDMYEYITNGHANDVTQMQKKGTVYTSKGAIENFHTKISLGEKLNFGNNYKIENAFIYGLSDGGGSHTWSLGKKAKLSLVLDEDNFTDDELALLLRFKYIYGNSQRIKCYINGKFIEEKTVTSVGKPITFVFSPELISDTGILEIEFEYPDAFRKKDSDEIRVLAFAFEQMIIDSAKNLFSYITVGEEKVSVDFSVNGNSDKLIDEGWHGQEAKHRWTSGDANIVFYDADARNYLLTVEYLTYKHSGDTHVLYNGEEIARWSKNPAIHTESVVLPAKLFNDKGIQTVTFITDNATSPLRSGESEDGRILGISVRSIALDVID